MNDVLHSILSFVLPFVLLSSFSRSSSSRESTSAVSESASVDWKAAAKMALLLTATVGVFLYFLLFSTLTPVHDATHGLRHSLAVIPCH